MNLLEVSKAISEISFGDWKFELITKNSGGLWFLRISFPTEDNWDPARGGITHHGRKWRLSQYMTKSEIVQTALLAVLTAQEHETREKFLYKGKAIFHPHYDVDALLGIVDQVDLRT